MFPKFHPNPNSSIIFFEVISSSKYLDSLKSFKADVLLNVAIGSVIKISLEGSSPKGVRPASIKALIKFPFSHLR